MGKRGNKREQWVTSGNRCNRGKKGIRGNKG